MRPKDVNYLIDLILGIIGVAAVMTFIELVL